jgi:hypothetical protein
MLDEIKPDGKQNLLKTRLIDHINLCHLVELSDKVS